MKILAIDIETRPSLAYVWKLWDENVSLAQLVESGEMISFAAKWIGVDGIEFRSVYHDGKKKMVNRVWKLLNEADAVLHFNGKKFDVPHIQREFLEAGLNPPAPFKQIDLLSTCRTQFRFPSNKLEYVVKQLGLGTKVKHDGFELWLRCMNKDKDAWELMKQYNINDTELLEELYEILRPWIKVHPSHAALTGEHVCPRCGKDDLILRGFTILTTGKYQRYECKNCGGWSRGTKRIETSDVTTE